MCPIELIEHRNPEERFVSRIQIVGTLQTLLVSPIQNCGIAQSLLPSLLQCVVHPSQEIALLALWVLQKLLKSIDDVDSVIDQRFTDRILGVSLQYSDPCMQSAVAHVIAFLPPSRLIQVVSPFPRSKR